MNHTMKLNVCYCVFLISLYIFSEICSNDLVGLRHLDFLYRAGETDLLKGGCCKLAYLC